MVFRCERRLNESKVLDTSLTEGAAPPRSHLTADRQEEDSSVGSGRSRVERAVLRWCFWAGRRVAPVHFSLA